MSFKVVGNFVGFVKMMETKNFDTGQRNHEVLNLERFSWYDFESESMF
jgi:hypothetical protein